MNKLSFGFKAEKFIVGIEHIKRVVLRHVCVKSESLAAFFVEIEFKLLLPLIDLARGCLRRLNQLVCPRMDGNSDFFSRFWSENAELADDEASAMSLRYPCVPSGPWKSPLNSDGKSSLR